MNWLNGAVIHMAGLFVPEPDRADWLAEWNSELWYVPDGRALGFSLGAFQDAFWVRRNSSARRQYLRLESPTLCLAALAVAAAIAALVFSQSPGLLDAAFHNPRARRDMVFVYILLTIVALVVLPTTTSVALGEYPTGRIRRWIFLLSKLALIFLIVFFGSLDVSPIFGVPFLPDAALLGYVLGFRWAFVDQRQRCPVCLRLLSSPARLGDAAHTLLDLYGTELVCARGHGLMHVPEIQSSYTTQRWLDLDDSWQSLFSR